jgi:hypothetical protein
MRNVYITTAQGNVVVMLIQQPEQDDKMFDDLAIAIILTIANDTGLQLTKVEAP